MPKASDTRDGVQQTSRDSKIKALEEQARKLRHVNDDLRHQVFLCSQRDTRIAENMGFATAEELQAAMSARPHIYTKSFIEDAARTIERLEERVGEHIRLDATSSAGLADAAKEIDRLTEENARLNDRAEGVAKERDELARRVQELEGMLASRPPPETTVTGLPTPATSKKRPQPPVATPSTASTSSRPSEPTLTVTPATARLPPLTLSPDEEDDPSVLRAELRALHAQYEVLRKVKERAEAKYRADYAKWLGFKRWMFDEEKASLADIIVDGRTPNLKNVLRVRQKYVRSGPGGSPAVREAVGSDIELRETVAALPDAFDKADEAAPQSSLTAKLLEARGARPSNTPPVQDTAAAASTSVAPSPSRPAPAPMSAIAQGKQRASEPEAPGPPAQARASSPTSPPRKQQGYEDSSETEEESQALSPVLGSQPGIRRLVPMPDGTYVRRGYGPYPTDAQSSAKPTVPPSPSPSTPRKAGTPGSRHSKRSATKSSPSSRPSTPRRRKDRLVGSPAGTPTRRTPGTRERKDKENPSGATTAARDARPRDYSAYKGRGRYAAANQTKGAGDETINAEYEIDAARNNGVDHPFDEVVRDKERRRRLHGADCECCREYYHAVGKLPPRPQPPPWRSPHTTPTKATSSARRHLGDASSVPNSPRKRRDRGADEDEEDADAAAIAAHVQQISRHRQQWERPKTPPGYWEIAFPDTQEAAAINAQAREMHRQKRARVEEEASRGGRYKKRKS